MSSEPVIVNALNKTALDGVQKAMMENPTLGANAEVKVEAVWHQGVVQTPSSQGFALIAYAPPGLGLEDKAPTVLSYCPSMVAGCYSLIVMLSCAEQGLQLESYSTTTTSTADLTPLYQPLNTSPWKKVHLQVTYQGNVPLADFQALADQAHDRCPSVEVLERAFPVATTVTSTQVKVEDQKVYYNLERYHELAASSLPVTVEQSSTGTWNCQGQDDGIFTMTAEGESVTITQEPPIGPGGAHANPVQACFFGALAFSMHTLALRLSSKGYHVQAMQGSFSALLNKRKVLGVEPEAPAFSAPAQMVIDVESDAPPSVMAEAKSEMEQSSPGYLGMMHPIPLELSVTKEE